MTSKIDHFESGKNDISAASEAILEGTAQPIKKAADTLKKLVDDSDERIFNVKTLNELRELSGILYAETNTSDKKQAERRWRKETKLLDFPKFLGKLVQAERNAESGKEVKHVLLSMIRYAIRVLVNATKMSAKFCEVVYEQNVTSLVMIILERDFCEDQTKQTQLKHLDFTDAAGCVQVLQNTLNYEPRVTKQLRNEKWRKILSRLFKCKKIDVALQAISLSAKLTNGKQDEPRVPKEILEYLVGTLVDTLNGEIKDKEGNKTSADSCLHHLRKLIQCSDDFNQQVMQYKQKITELSLLDILTDVLEAPEPSSGGYITFYAHEVNPNNASYNPKQLKTTYYEKWKATYICWALLQSEKHDRNNSHALRKHNRILDALTKAASSTDKDTSYYAKGVLNEMKLIDTALSTDPSGETVAQDAEENQNKKKLLKKRPTTRPNVVSRNKSTEKPGENIDRTTKHRKTAKGSETRPATSHQKQFAHGTVSAAPNKINSSMVMISYSSHYKPELVHRINKSLQDKKIDTWIYTEKLHGDIFEAMAKAVEQCAVVLVCYSSAYSESHPCRQELNYARVNKKPTVFVRLENFKPFGWLGISVAGVNYHDFASKKDDDEALDERHYNATVEKLISELKTHYLCLQATSNE